jgi:prepilin-type N-terminal cleavage/methylation domain-containing protein
MSPNKEQSAMLARKLTSSRARRSRTPNPERLRAPRLSAFRFPLSTSRRAFTIIELLVVVIVIAILMALILPAIGNARIRAQEAKVIVEIRQLESAITAFKVKYGIEPPSRISIYRTQPEWDAPTAAADKAIIKRIWPQFDFTMPGGAGTAYPSTWTKTQNINCGECMMFFLGGIYENGVPTGFAKNPATPFAPRSVAASREGPFMEFDAGRITDTENSTVNNNNMPEYLDSLPDRAGKPFLYFSSYEGRGYKVSELPSGSSMQDVYRVNNATATPGPATQGFPAQKAQTFQIISPGFDNDYGKGGVFNSNLGNAGLSDRGDFDNLTNFHGGRLNP